MATYKYLVEKLIERQIGIFGEASMMSMLEKAEMYVDESWKLKADECSMHDLDRLMQAFKGSYGTMGVLGCKILAQRIARENNLRLPPLLK